MFGLNQIYREPRGFSAWLPLGQFLVLWRIGMGLVSQSSYLAWFARWIRRRICATKPAGGDVWTSQNGMCGERDLEI